MHEHPLGDALFCAGGELYYQVQHMKKENTHTANLL